jgi:hypothetical protein
MLLVNLFVMKEGDVAPTYHDLSYCGTRIVERLYMVRLCRCPALEQLTWITFA